MKTYSKSAKTIQRKWHLVDAKGKVLGRLASDIAKYLMGKNKVDYTPHLDMGDHVVVTNASEVAVTGKKAKQKMYYSHSGYPGGFKEVSFAKVKADNPKKIIEYAVKRMLPDNRLKKFRMARLHVYAQATHPYEEKIKTN